MQNSVIFVYKIIAISRNSNVYEHPSNETLRELGKRLALDVELYLFAKQRLFTIHETMKR